MLETCRGMAVFEVVKLVYPTLWMGVGISCSIVSLVIQIPIRFFVFFLLFLVKKTIFNQVVNAHPIQGEKILFATISRISDNPF